MSHSALRDRRGIGSGRLCQARGPGCSGGGSCWQSSDHLSSLTATLASCFPFRAPTFHAKSLPQT